MENSKIIMRIFAKGFRLKRSIRRKMSSSRRLSNAGDEEVNPRMPDFDEIPGPVASSDDQPQHEEDARSSASRQSSVPEPEMSSEAGSSEDASNAESDAEEYFEEVHGYEIVNIDVAGDDDEDWSDFESRSHFYNSDEDFCNDLEVFNYDASIPPQHTYVSVQAELFPVRASNPIFDHGERLSDFPVMTFSFDAIVFVPEMTVLLKINYSHFRQFQSLDKNNRQVFGVRVAKAKVGTTMEIIEAETLSNPHDQFPIILKCRTKQRFRLCHAASERFQPDAFAPRDVVIMEDALLSYPYEECRCRSLDKIKPKDSRRRQTLLRYNVPSFLSPWPAFVFKQYDPDFLADQILKFFDEKTKVRKKFLAVIPTNPSALSFWLLRYLPLRVQAKQEILSLDTANQRLRTLMTQLKSSEYLMCIGCAAELCRFEDSVSMSLDGPVATYTNPAGYIYNTMTFSRLKADCVEISRTSSAYFSWFPGYAASSISCKQCNHFLGWFFARTERATYPACFYGLSQRNISIFFKRDERV